MYESVSRISQCAKNIHTDIYNKIDDSLTDRNLRNQIIVSSSAGFWHATAIESLLNAKRKTPPPRILAFRAYHRRVDHDHYIQGIKQAIGRAKAMISMRDMSRRKLPHCFGRFRLDRFKVSGVHQSRTMGFMFPPEIEELNHSLLAHFIDSIYDKWKMHS